MSDEEKRNWFKNTPFFSKRKTYEPWYDDEQDFNTNAKSYYDYLARFNHLISTIIDHINRALDRDLAFKNTPSIDFSKSGDWKEGDKCDSYDDLLQIQADVNLSKSTEIRTLKNTSKKSFTVSNEIIEKTNGIWSPDYLDLINELDKTIGDLKTQITNLENKNATLENGLQKIVDNLYKSRTINSNKIESFTFNQNRDIASGNINLFGGTPDGNSFIRTNNSSSNNDISAGY